MTFEFDLGEIRIKTSSLESARRLAEKGARLANPAQADDLYRALESQRTPLPIRPSDGAAAS